jgi:Phage integrase family
VERPIAVVFGEEPEAGYVFSPGPDHARPFSRYYLSEAVSALLKPVNLALTLHSLRHTFATWRLEMGEPMAQVQTLMGHADANTLMRYAHIEPDPLADLLPLLRRYPAGSSSRFPPAILLHKSSRHLGSLGNTGMFTGDQGCAIAGNVQGKTRVRGRRRRMGIEPTHRGLNPEHWI